MIQAGDRSIRGRLEEMKIELERDPYHSRPNLDIRLISSGREGIRRVRLGRYRVVYEVDEKEKRVRITTIFSRERGY